jgi:hypothetical protein
MRHTPDPRPLDALEEKLRAGCALRWRPLRFWSAIRKSRTPWL